MQFSPNEISQLLMIGIAADGDFSPVTELQPGGIILMGRNAGTPVEMRRFNRRIRELCDTPPLIATDQEGGRVQRLTDGFTAIPSAQELGQQGARAVSLMAMNVAAELRGAGLNTNFAPVCDVPSHPDDTVIGNRAFSTDPITASLLVAEYVRGTGTTILACAKHFPGHGAVGVDSHKDLPTFDGTRADLDSHLGPFRSAIAAGVGAVMVAHISVPCLDASGAPATLSAPVITDLLREELNFRGLVIADDLEMGALSSEEPGEIAVRAIAAGCDLLLFCHAPEKARVARDAIAAAVEDGRLAPQRVRDAIDRVQWAKRKYGVITED
jgi:beta-N-acetylhexosaminidase